MTKRREIGADNYSENNTESITRVAENSNSEESDIDISDDDDLDKLNLHPGGKQPHLRDGFIYAQQVLQSIQFPPDYVNPELAGKPKGIKQILQERGLWKKTYRLDCPKCPPDKGDCCGRKVLAAERDFHEQKGQLREELEARGQVVIFLPKFHCELNPIEPYWCQAKWYCRENCDYTFSGLRDTVPKALASVRNSTIFGFLEQDFSCY